MNNINCEWNARGQCLEINSGAWKIGYVANEHNGTGFEPVLTLGETNSSLTFKELQFVMDEWTRLAQV